MKALLPPGWPRPKGYSAPSHEPGETLAEELKACVKAAIAPFKYPREIAFVDALSKTATGKLQRFALRNGSAAP